MDLSDTDVSWSSSEADALLAALVPPRAKPTSEVSVVVNGAEDPHRAKCSGRDLKSVPGISGHNAPALRCSDTPDPIELKIRASKGLQLRIRHLFGDSPPPRPSTPITPKIRLLPRRSPGQRVSRRARLPPRLSGNPSRPLPGASAVEPHRPSSSSSGPPRPSEDRRTSRGAHCLPPSRNLPLPPDLGNKIPRASEDRRTAQGNCCPSSTQVPSPSFPSDGNTRGSEDRRTPPCKPRPPSLTSKPIPTDLVKGQVSEDRRASWSRAGLLPSRPSLPPPPSSPPPPSREVRDPEASRCGTPGQGPKKRGTRRAGRKNQLRRLWNLHRGLDPITGSEPKVNPPTQLAPDAAPPGITEPAPLPRASRVLRVRSNEPYTGPRITRWRLIHLRQPAVVYPAIIPVGDPRREVYLRKRAGVLYPLPRFP